MNQVQAAMEWAYDSDEDRWVSKRDEIAIDGVIVRQLARQLLRARRSRALSVLEARCAHAPQAESVYRQAVVDVLRSDWAMPIAA